MIKGWKKYLVGFGVPFIGLLIYWYIVLTPLNFQEPLFWLNLLVYLVVSTVLVNMLDLRHGAKAIRISAGIIAVGVVLLAAALLIGSPLLRSRSYADLLTYSEGDFSEDLDWEDPAAIPTVDREMAQRLGSRKIGEMLELVSQFDVGDEYTQIAYNGESVRVSPLEYVNFFRWLNNRDSGIPFYVTVNMVSGAAEMVELEEGIHYSHSGFFNDDITRHLFLSHPTTMFENPVLELDEEGHPYYVAPIVQRKFSILGAKDVTGAFVVDAITGEIRRYSLEEVPAWVDRVYPADMLMRQINYNGAYQQGFWNSVIAKRGVIQNAEGYNYLVLDNDLYLYTGLTSVASDESNIGFVLINSRTKEAKRYNVSTATEWSAMESAQGSVQEKGYTSTFPLLFNMNGEAVYQLSLKDDAGLIKLYAFVDAMNYQKVAVGSTLTQAWNNYSGGVTEIPEEGGNGEELPVETITGTVAAIASAVVDGETVYYFTLDDSADIYTARVTINDQLPFVEAGNVITVEVSGNEVQSLLMEETE